MRTTIHRVNEIKIERDFVQVENMLPNETITITIKKAGEEFKIVCFSKEGGKIEIGEIEDAIND